MQSISFLKQMKAPIVQDIGIAPWDEQALIRALPEFEEVLKSRPFFHNEGGMGTPHLFATWFLLRELNPPTIIESGVWKGLGTWLIEQACPSAKLISIDPHLGKREYISPRVTYYDVDFTEIDWSSLDRANTVIFFDDHQNALNRLTQARWFGFRHLIFEDNYTGTQGDFYSLRHAMEHSGFGIHTASAKAAHYRSFTARALRKLNAIAARFGVAQTSAIPQYVRDQVAPNAFDAYFLRQNLELYYEFPPVFSPDTPAQPPPPCRKPPLLPDHRREAHPEFYRDRARYNQLCYVILNTLGAPASAPLL